MGSIIWEGERDRLVPLRRPVLIAAFDGWNDAANAASSAVGWLRQRWTAERVAVIDAQQHFDFQSARPSIELRNGVLRALRYPTIELLVAPIPGSERDAVLCHGPEPNVGWRTFCGEIIDAARELGCETLITLGAMLADVPHTRPTPITGVAHDARVIGSLELRSSSYEGPTGIVGVLVDACRHASMPALSLWAPVPHYVGTPPNPRATQALLRSVQDATELATGWAALDGTVRTWVAHIDQAVADDTETQEYVRALEARYDNAPLDAPDGGDDDDEDGELDLDGLGIETFGESVLGEFGSYEDTDDDSGVGMLPISDDAPGQTDDDVRIDPEDTDALIAELEQFLRGQDDDPSA